MDTLNLLAKTILNNKTVKINDLSSLRNRYELLKSRNYIKYLNGYKPDKLDSIIQLYDLITEASKHYKEILVYAFDSIAFEYFLSDIVHHIKSDRIFATPLSSVFPTTTAVAWPSILKGLHPSKHGIYGTSFLLEPFNCNYIWMNNCLKKKDIRTNLSDNPNLKFTLMKDTKKTIFENLAERDFNGFFLDPYQGGNKLPLFREATMGAEFIEGNDNYKELLEKPKALLDYIFDKDLELLSNTKGKKFIWNFVDYDLFVHLHGYEGFSPEELWTHFFNFWYKNKNDDRLFMFISDHGQIPQIKPYINVLEASINYLDLENNTAGAGRTLYFYPKKGKNKQVLSWLKNDVVKNNGTILTKEDLVKFGLLDKDAVAKSRIGDIIAIATNNRFPSTGYEYIYEHGALTSTEMYVPFLIF